MGGGGPEVGGPMGLRSPGLDMLTAAGLCTTDEIRAIGRSSCLGLFAASCAVACKLLCTLSRIRREFSW